MYFMNLHSAYSFSVNRCSRFIFIILFIVNSSVLTSFSSLAQNSDFLKSQLNTKADSLVMDEEYSEAEQLYFQARTKASVCEDPLNTIHALNRLGYIYITRMDYIQAEKYFTEAGQNIDQLETKKNNPVADNFMYKGLFYTRTNAFDSAIYYHDKSIDLRKELFGEQAFELADNYYFKGQLYHRMSNYSKAEELYRSAIEIYSLYLPENHDTFGRLYSELTKCLRVQFDFMNAIQYGKQSIEITKDNPKKKLRQLVTTYISLANVYNEIEQWEEAIFYYSEATGLIDSDENLYRIYAPYLNLNMASMHILDDQLIRGKELLDKGYNLLVQTKSQISSLWAFSYLLYGVYFTRTDQFDLAKEHLFEAINMFDSLSMQQFLSNSYEYTGDCYQQFSMPDSALYYYQLALITLVEDFSDMDINKNPTKYDVQDVSRLYDILYKKASAFRKYYMFNQDQVKYLNSSLDIYLLINRLNDETRNSPTTDASLLLINEYYRPEYEKGIDCAYELFRLAGDLEYVEKAFILMEKSKYMLLFEALTLAEKRKAINLPEEIKSLEDSLRAQYENLKRELDVAEIQDSTDQNYINAVQDRLFKNNKAQDDLKIRIANDYPAYHQIKYDSLIKSLGDFRNYCKDNKVLGIEYFWGEKAIYVIAIDQEKNTFSKIVRSKKLNDALSQYLHHLSSGPDMSSIDVDYRSYIKCANYVYQELLEKPLNTYGLPNQKQDMIIIPDGLLAQVSFEALLSKSGDSTYTDYATLPYLIQSTNIGYVYSANLLLNERSTEKKPKNDLLAFSYSDEDSYTEITSRSLQGVELPHTALELLAIQKAIRGKYYYFDEDATEHRFKKQASDFRILHLAVHGIADSISAGNSRLIFKNDTDSIEDGTLFTYELYNLDLSRTQLAVLSACQTGIGKEFTGEGVFSMASGFAYAGCPSIIMSLWRVSDKFTADLMGNFYKKIKKGNKGKEALRASKLQYLEESGEYSAHPSNWASFVFLGNDDQYFNRKISISIIGSIILIILLIWILARRFLPFS